MARASQAIVGALLLQVTLVAFAQAEEFKWSQFELPAELAESVKNFCAKAAPRKADFVDYVDGYATECGGSIDNCVRPLFRGYSFIEIENSKGGASRNNGLPQGLYRAEVVDATEESCRIFDAANVGRTLSDIFRGLRQQKKCIGLTRIKSFKSDYKFEWTFLRTPEASSAFEANSSVYAHSIVRLSDAAIVAQVTTASMHISDDASISCDAPVSMDGLIAAAIPPRAYAPLP